MIVSSNANLPNVIESHEASPQAVASTSSSSQLATEEPIVDIPIPQASPQLICNDENDSQSCRGRSRGHGQGCGCGRGCGNSVCLDMSLSIPSNIEGANLTDIQRADHNYENENQSASADTQSTENDIPDDSSPFLPILNDVSTLQGVTDSTLSSSDGSQAPSNAPQNLSGDDSQAPSNVQNQNETHRHRAIKRKQVDYDDWDFVNNRKPKRFKFCGKEEVHYSFNSAKPKPMEFFSLLFGNDMMDEIMKFINLHAEKLETSLKDWKKGADFIKNWKKLVLPEFRKFVGLAFLMGNPGFPEHRLYWSETSLYHHPNFSKTIKPKSFSIYFESAVLL